MSRTIVVFAYCSGAEQRHKVEYFERLDRALRRDGYRLYLVNVGPTRFRSRISHTTMPACVTFANKIPGDAYFKRDAFSGGLREAAAVEAAIRNSPILTAGVKVVFFRHFCRSVLLEKQPALCVIWHQFNGLHRGLADLCQDFAIPVMYAEYGSLPGTIVFEAGGQMAESWVARERERFVRLPLEDADFAMAEHLLDAMHEEKKTRKVQASDVSVASIAEDCAKKGRAIIFYAGQNDPQTGMAPSWLPEAKTHSPNYADTHEALRLLVELAERHDWHVIFKPHPMLEKKHALFEVPYPERLDTVIGANIFDCMDAAKVTVTILSQVSYLALIHGHACVLLGRNQLSGKGCVYEPGTKEDLADAIQDAMRSGFSVVQQSQWLRHVAQLAKYYLFAFEPDIVRIIDRDVDTVATFLAEHAGQTDTDDKPTGAVGAPATDEFGDDLREASRPAEFRRKYRLLCALDFPIRVFLLKRPKFILSKVFARFLAMSP